MIKEVRVNKALVGKLGIIKKLQELSIKYHSKCYYSLITNRLLEELYVIKMIMDLFFFVIKGIYSLILHPSNRIDMVITNSLIIFQTG